VQVRVRVADGGRVDALEVECLAERTCEPETATPTAAASRASRSSNAEAWRRGDTNRCPSNGLGFCGMTLAWKPTTSGASIRRPPFTSPATWRQMRQSVVLSEPGDDIGRVPVGREDRVEDLDDLAALGDEREPLVERPAGDLERR
jgi:hypothetical protein